jgi:hypothetical protein
MEIRATERRAITPTIMGTIMLRPITDRRLEACGCKFYLSEFAKPEICSGSRGGLFPAYAIATCRSWSQGSWSPCLVHTAVLEDTG